MKINTLNCMFEINLPLFLVIINCIYLFRLSFMYLFHHHDNEGRSVCPNYFSKQFCDCVSFLMFASS